MKRILYTPFDHLHRNYGALKDADPKEDVIASSTKKDHFRKRGDEPQGSFWFY